MLKKRRFEKGQKDGNYINKYIRKEKKYKKEIDKKDKIIEEMSRIFIKQGIKIDILSPEAQEEVKKYFENSTINYSFEIMKPTQSIINMNNKNTKKEKKDD